MNFSRGFTFGATETVTNAKLHALIDDASGSGITNADIASDALIDSSKINFTLSDYVTLAGDQTITGTKTFSNTQIFSTPLANTNIAAITQASKVAGSSFYALASCISGAGKLPLANIPTIDSLLPSQTDNSGKFLTTNGSAASWGAVAGFTSGYWIGSETRRTNEESGDVAVTGVGFTPKLVVAFANYGQGYYSFGSSTGSTSNKGTSTGYNGALYSGDFLWCIGTAGAGQYVQTTTIKSFDADGFTYTKTRSGGTASLNDFVVVYIAFK